MALRGAGGRGGLASAGRAVRRAPAGWQVAGGAARGGGAVPHTQPADQAAEAGATTATQAVPAPAKVRHRVRRPARVIRPQ